MAEVTKIKTPAEAGFAQLFDAVKGSLPGNASGREEAFRAFAERGLPHRRVEEFKYTDLRALLREATPLAPTPSAADVEAAIGSGGPFGGVDALRIALVNGHLVADRSDLGRLPAGVEIVSLRDALASGHPLLSQMSPVAAARENPIYQLNAAFMTDGAVIRIAAGTTVEVPLHLAFAKTGSEAFSTATRTLVVVEEGASVTLLESHTGPAGVAYQANEALEIVAADHAKVAHVRINGESLEAIALSTLTARLGAHVSFDSINAVVGSAVSRHQVYVKFTGDHARGAINGATMLTGRQHADSTLVVEHDSLHCESRELFKTVIDSEATGVFQGKIIVQPHAQKTDGRMMSAALLLSEGGTMNNKPELEIFADDVVCAHGATCGQLDEDLLFYLMARGLPRPEAESLLTQAFLGEAIETVENEQAREALIAVLEVWLRSRV